MKTCFRMLAGGAALAIMPAPVGAATYLFNFNFDAVDSYSAASIVYSADSISATTLNYVSGSVNGFTTPMIVKGLLGGPSYAPNDYFGNGALPTGTVAGFFFRTDQDPISVGIWPTTSTAGRSISYGDGGAMFIYSSGRLVVSAMAPVPEPASWALMIGGFALAGAALRRRTGVAMRFV